MKRVLVITLLASLLLVGRSFAHKKDTGEFPLTVHVTAVDMQQGTAGVRGGGSTDYNGNYSSSVNGGESYTWHLYTAQVDGDNKTYGLSTRAYKDGIGLALPTIGRSGVDWGHRNAQLHLGDYRGCWNKDGTLEIQFTDEKSRLKHQTFRIESEKASSASAVPTASSPIPAPASVVPTPAPAVPVAYQQQGEVRVEPATQTSVQLVREEESLGDTARRAKQRKACLELAKDNPSITCQ